VAKEQSLGSEAL